MFPRAKGGSATCTLKVENPPPPDEQANVTAGGALSHKEQKAEGELAKEDNRRPFTDDQTRRPPR